MLRAGIRLLSSEEKKIPACWDQNNYRSRVNSHEASLPYTPLIHSSSAGHPALPCTHRSRKVSLGQALTFLIHPSVHPSTQDECPHLLGTGPASRDSWGELEQSKAGSCWSSDLQFGPEKADFQACFAPGQGKALFCCTPGAALRQLALRGAETRGSRCHSCSSQTDTPREAEPLCLLPPPPEQRALPALAAASFPLEPVQSQAPWHLQNIFFFACESQKQRVWNRHKRLLCHCGDSC